MKRLTNNSTYEVITSRARYAVVLRHLSNTTNGQPRFEADIITLEVFGERKPERFFFSSCWRFKGHYANDEGEAKEAVRQYEEILKKDGTF